ncbi:AAA family ATPase [Lutispora sp.]|uniref:AAA family ATPase n=1 Tax=Lutispora sp. TaxID=2828727 RepID=UPI002B20357F|nr:AAA family ATPase [Lutispora sp.]MEA4963548.1 AAA family ATPase [Lutispora sp.]
MEQINKIVIIHNDNGFVKKVEELSKEWTIYEPQVVWLQSFIKEAIKEADCIIIDGSSIKDIKSLIAEMRKAYDKKIIFLFNTLNHPNAHIATIHGADVFYMHSPSASLMYKIYGTHSLDKNIPQTISSEQLRQGKKGSILTIYSPKGGCGKTTLSINLSIQYAQKGLRVLLADFAQFGAVGVNLKIVHRGTGFSGILASMESGDGNMMKEDLPGIIEKNVYKHCEKWGQFDVLITSAPIKMEKIGVAEVETILKSFRQMDYDIVIIDTSSELSKRNLALLELSDHLLFIAGPDLASGWSIIQFKEVLRSLGIKSKPYFVVNMYSKSSGFSCREMEAELEYPLICAVPECKELQYLANMGQPIGYHKKHWMNVFYRRIAHQIVPIFSKKELGLKRIGLF